MQYGLCSFRILTWWSDSDERCRDLQELVERCVFFFMASAHDAVRFGKHSPTECQRNHMQVKFISLTTWLRKGLHATSSSRLWRLSSACAVRAMRCSTCGTPSMSSVASSDHRSHGHSSPSWCVASFRSSQSSHRPELSCWTLHWAPHSQRSVVAPPGVLR